MAFHKDAPLAHLASLAAFEQGKFWEYHDKLFQDTKKLKLDNLKQYAQDMGLDMDKFNQAIVDPANFKIIDADKAEAVAIKATGTPAFFVNGRYLSGAKPFDDFAKVINAELTRLKVPVPAAAQAVK